MSFSLIWYTSASGKVSSIGEWVDMMNWQLSATSRSMFCIRRMITGGGFGVVPQHTHDAGDITTGAIHIAHGGTGQTAAAQGLIALGGVTALR